MPEIVIARKFAAFVALSSIIALSFVACVAEPVDSEGSEGADDIENVGVAQEELKANWQSCGSDSECTSNWCGCNGGTTRVCLPNTSYTKKCGNWTTCWSDSQCLSNWCGCNGGNTMYCLPNTSYPKNCSL